MESVAAWSGVNKTIPYHWWPPKAPYWSPRRWTPICWLRWASPSPAPGRCARGGARPTTPNGASANRSIAWIRVSSSTGVRVRSRVRCALSARVGPPVQRGQFDVAAGDDRCRNRRCHHMFGQLDRVIDAQAAFGVLTARDDLLHGADLESEHRDRIAFENSRGVAEIGGDMRAVQRVLWCRSATGQYRCGDQGGDRTDAYRLCHADAVLEGAFRCEPSGRAVPLYICAGGKFGVPISPTAARARRRRGSRVGQRAGRTPHRLCSVQLTIATLST